MKESVQYLEVNPNSSVDYHVRLREVAMNFTDEPPPGTAWINVLQTAPCGSDNGKGGYYGNGRYQKDLNDQTKLLKNLDFLRFQNGYVAPAETMEAFLRSPDHEAVAVVTAAQSGEDGKPIPIALFAPDIVNGRISGVSYQVREVDFNRVKEGDLVVPHAGWRCRQHRSPNPKTGFPDKCERHWDNGHQGKMVPGHRERPGYAHHADGGKMPYPVSMLSVVPDATRAWIAQKPAERLVVATQAEPLSCCFEAFNPTLLNGEQPRRIGIIGDGANAAQLALFSTVAFPHSDVFVVGKTDEKLQAIQNIAPGRIHPVKIGRATDTRYGHRELAQELRGEKLDVLVPTVYVAPDLKPFAGIVNQETGRVIIWAAEQTHKDERFRFEGIGNPKLNGNPHPSYGGWHAAEESAVMMIDALVRTNNTAPLDAYARYPFHYMPMDEAVQPMQQLINTGRYTVEAHGEGRKTSGKVIIWNGPNIGTLFNFNPGQPAFGLAV